MNRRPTRQAAAYGKRSALKPLGRQAVRVHPIHLGWWFLGILVGGLGVIGVWTVTQLHPGVDVVGAVSVGVSAAATYAVSMLAAVALINFTAWIRRSDYIWILPADFVDIPLDWPIAAAVVAGLIAGKLYWH